MSRDDVIGLLMGAVVTGLFAFAFGFDKGKAVAKKEAFERGAAVQCVGKKGYFWECEE